MQGSKEAVVNTDISGKTETKNDVTENAIDNSPSDEVNIEGEKGEESNNSDDMSAPLFTELTERRCQVYPKILTLKNIHRGQRKED